MSTKKLAQELGLLRKRSQSSTRREEIKLSNQIFSYLIVIDFESTCWREKKHYGQEIIEFPAVMLNTSTGELEAEFHCYVQPQEHPVLSDFCTELTGITQVQVESGVPLHICLSRFSRWLQTQQLQRGVAFSRGPTPSQKLCAFVTWSDWDLGVCLQYECTRKQLHKPEVLNSWIDLRSTYRLFYSRKPKGLNGALQDLGIQFSGRQHSGLDDARNTAMLAWRMMKDGCVMKITRGPERAPLKTKALFTNTSVNSTINKNNNKDKHTGSSFPCLEPQPHRLHPSENRSTPRPEGNPQRNNRTSDPLQNLLSPLTTVMNHLNSPLCGGRIGSVNNNNNNINSNSSRLVLVSTTLDHVSHQPQLELTSDPEAVLSWEEEVSILLDSERCGSYDDVVLEEGGEEVNTATHSHTLRNTHTATHTPGNTHTATHTTKHTPGNTHTLNHTHKPEQSSFSVYRDPPNLSSSSHLPPPRSSSRPPPSSSSRPPPSSSSHPPPSSSSHPPSSSTSRLYSSVLCSSSFRPPSSSSHPPSSSSSIPSSSSPSHLPPHPLSSSSHPSSTSRLYSSVLCSSSSRLPPSSSSRPPPSSSSRPPPSSSSRPPPSSSSRRPSLLSTSLNISSRLLASGGVAKITSPLCACGRRAKRQTVANGGPNQGRAFYCCPAPRTVGMATIGRRKRAGCGFFRWESAVINSTGPLPTATPLSRATAWQSSVGF